MNEQQAPHGATVEQAPQGAYDGPQGGYGGGYGAVHGGGYRPPAPQGGSGTAITALVIGIVSLLLCWVPIVNNGVAVLAVVGLVLALVAERRARKGRAGGRGTARAGLVLSILAIVGVLASQAFYAAVLDEVGEELDRAGEDFQESLDEVDDELDGDSAVSDDDQAARVAAVEALAVGAAGTVGEYDVTVAAVDLDAGEAIAAANQFNGTAAGRYVLVTLDVTYTGTEEGDPWLDLGATLVGSDARNYDESSCGAVEPNPGMELPTLTAGGRGTYDVCFDVPDAGLLEPELYVEESFSFDGERTYWSLR